MNHFTDRDGYNAIGSQVVWVFLARQPHAAHNPVGAYFTSYSHTEPNLAKKIFVPRTKLAYLFEFTPPSELKELPGGRGRLKHIFYSPEDYSVPKTHQIRQGATEL